MLRINAISGVVEAQGKQSKLWTDYVAKLNNAGIAVDSTIETLFDSVQHNLQQRDNAVKALKSHKDYVLISYEFPKIGKNIERETKTLEINGIIETVNAVITEKGKGFTRRTSNGIKHTLKDNKELSFLLSEVQRYDVLTRESRLQLQQYVHELQVQRLELARLSTLNGSANANPAGVTVLIAHGLPCDYKACDVATKAPQDFMIDTSYVLKSNDAQRLQRLQGIARDNGIVCTEITAIMDVQGKHAVSIGSKRNQVESFSEVLSDRNYDTVAYYECTLVRCGGENLRKITHCNPVAWSVFCETIQHNKLISKDYYVDALPRKRQPVDKSSITYKSLKPGYILSDSDIGEIERMQSKADSKAIKRELESAYRAIDTQVALQGLIDEALSIIEADKAKTIETVMQRENKTRSSVVNTRYESNLSSEKLAARRLQQAQLMRERRAKLKAVTS